VPYLLLKPVSAGERHALQARRTPSSTPRRCRRLSQAPRPARIL
jgi:hypothetical protein